MKATTSLLTLALSGMGLAVPAPFPEGTLPAPPEGVTNFTTLIEDKGPGYNVLLAVETAPNKDKAIVAWAYGRFQCTERQLVSKGANDFCGKTLTFDRVPELDDQNEATGGQEKITVQFQGCGDASKGGDYSGIVIQDSKGYYDCNADRELHGCDYNNSELDTDLAAFLSCGNYAYTPGDNSGDNDGPDKKPGKGDKGDDGDKGDNGDDDDDDDDDNGDGDDGDDSDN